MVYGDSRVPMKHKDVDDLIPPRMVHVFPEWTETKSATVDYTVPDESRPLEVRIQGKSLFVDPILLNDISPMFTTFLVREMVAGKRNTVDVKLEDVQYDHMLKILQFICPTELGLHPKPIDSGSFILMAKLSEKFKIPKLRAACELFVARLSLEGPSLYDFLTFLNVSCKYGINMETKIRLLEGALGHAGNAFIPLDTTISETVQSVFWKGAELNNNGLLNHASFEDRAKLKVPCRTCRAPYSPETIDRFVVCNDCKSTICGKCLRKPCPSKILIFLKRYTKTLNAQKEAQNIRDSF
ncbi:hypothetical protein L596_016160 [Steinernema carpocapsae]|nr:hypothetical protein L596_016160 [Steinernema carpocapsae]